MLVRNGCYESICLKGMWSVDHCAGENEFLADIMLPNLISSAMAAFLAMLCRTWDAPSGFTVVDVVARGRYPHQSLLRSWSEKDEAACVEAMEAANVLELADRPIEALSGGQRQRVWIAMTLAQQTPLILLDEPTTYLDITHQIEVLNLTKKLHSEGHTVAVVLHDLNLAFRYATHAVLMKEGRIIAQGDPQEIVTAELIQEVFDLESVICDDPCTGTPLVVPAAHQEITIAADAIAAAREGH